MRHRPQTNSDKTPQTAKKQNWLGMDLLVIIALPSLEAIEGQILSAVHSGLNMWIIGYIIAGSLVGIAIFLRGNEHYDKIKKLSKWTSKRKYIRYLPTIGIVILVIIRFIYPVLGESDITQDGIHGNTYVSKTLGFQVERPDDTWFFVTDIQKFKQIHGVNNEMTGYLGGVMIGKSFDHDVVAIWVIDPAKIQFSTMSELINRTLTETQSITHFPIYNLHEDISPDGNYATYNYDTIVPIKNETHIDVVMQTYDEKLYQRVTVSGMPKTLSEDVSNGLKFIVDHFKILN